MQAAEALKLVAGIGTSLAGRLQMLDARDMTWTTIRTPRDFVPPVQIPSPTVKPRRPFIDIAISRVDRPDRILKSGEQISVSGD